MSGVLKFFIFTLFWHGYNFKRVSYCKDLCEGKPIHTLCTYPTPSPSPQCTGWSDARLSDVEKQRLLNKLNQRRDEVAAGRSRRVPPAANMLNLHWVEELAESAQRWADQCTPHAVPDTRDQCRDLLTMTAGQTIATVIGASSGLTAAVMADMWYMEGLHYDGNVSSYMPPRQHHKDYTSFTQMVWATTFMVGCGRVRFMGYHGNRIQQLERLVCDWAPGGNVEGARVFAAGTPGSLCPTGAAKGHLMGHLCVYPEDIIQQLQEKLRTSISNINNRNSKKNKRFSGKELGVGETNADLQRNSIYNVRMTAMDSNLQVVGENYSKTSLEDFQLGRRDIPDFVKGFTTYDVMEDIMAPKKRKRNRAKGNSKKDVGMKVLFDEMMNTYGSPAPYDNVGFADDGSGENETLQKLLDELKPNVTENEYKSTTQITSVPTTTTAPITENISENTNFTIQKANDTKFIDFDFLSGMQDSMQAFKDELLALVNSTEINEETSVTTIKPKEGSKRKANTHESLDLGLDIITSQRPRQLVTLTKSAQASTIKSSNKSGNFGDILNDVLNVNVSDIFELFAEPVTVTSLSSTKEVLKTDEEYDEDETLKGWTGDELVLSEGPDVDDVTEFDVDNAKGHILNKSTTNSDEELVSAQDYNLLAIFTDKDSYYEDYSSISKGKVGDDDQDIYYDDDDAEALKKNYDPSKERPRLQGKLKSKRDKNNPSGNVSSSEMTSRQRKKSRKKEQTDNLTDEIPTKVEDAVNSLLKVLDGAFDATTNQSAAPKHSKKRKHSRRKGQTQKPRQKKVKKLTQSESGVDSEYDEVKEPDYYSDFPKENEIDNKQKVPETSARSAMQEKTFTEVIDEGFTDQFVTMTTASDAYSENFEDDVVVPYEPSHAANAESKVGDKDDMLYYEDGVDVATTTKRNILKKMSRSTNPHSKRKGRTKRPPSKIVDMPAPAVRKVLISNQYKAGEGVTFISPTPEPLGELEEPEFPQFFGPNSSIDSLPNAAKSLLRLFNDDIQKDNFPVSDVDLDSNVTDSDTSLPKRQQSKFFDDPDETVDENVFVPRRTDEELDERASFNEALEKVNSTDVLELFQSLRGRPLNGPAGLTRNAKKNKQKEKGHKRSRNGRKGHQKRGHKKRRRSKHMKRSKSRRSFPDNQLLTRKRNGKDVFYDDSVENLNAKYANGSDFETYHDSIQYADEDLENNSSSTLDEVVLAGKDNKTTRFPIQVRMNEDVNQTSPANMLFDEMSQNPGDKSSNLVARRHVNATFISERQSRGAVIADNDRPSLLNVSHALVSPASQLQILTTLYLMYVLVIVS